MKPILTAHLFPIVEARLLELLRSLTPPLTRTDDLGLGVFFYLPHVAFVAAYGLDPAHNNRRDPFEVSMRAQYELTRHNAGFLVLDQLADKHGASFAADRLAEKTEFKYKGRTIHLIKPTTFMNLSGKAIAYWLQELKIEKENLLVVVDDIALPFGSLRLRTKGSSAGHNGLKSIELVLNNQQYSRLRFGVGDSFHKG